jgi:outer membrane protein OmpA-like peptidoglycan-associated protein
LVAQAQEDMEGSKDHPLLTRMRDFYISNYEEYDYDKASFYDDKETEYVIEGRKYVISYQLKDETKSPGNLNIVKNYENAIQKIGGTILSKSDDYTYMKVVKGGAETWICLWVQWDGGAYELTIVERKALEQQIVADPKAMGDDIMAQGHVAVYGIYFDTDKADIKPESEPTLKAIAQMLKNNPSLKVYVVGHSDSSGKLDYNMDLSAKRADAVVKALVSKYGIDATRLKAKGVGPLCPVESNKTEDGKAKNRRVELVEM